MFKKLIGDLKNKVETEIKKSIPNNSERKLEKETFTVMGVEYYVQNLTKIRTTNLECKKEFLEPYAKTYKYNYINKPVRLAPEPKNEHDKNAIQVLIAGELIGYIGRSDNIHVKEILKKCEIKYISSYIHGGPFKTLSSENKVINDEDPLVIKVSIGYVR